MQCVECDRPVRYDITSRCREHSLRYIESGDFKREALPNGRCRHCGTALPQSSKGRPYEKCSPCAKRWASMYQAVRRSRSKPLSNCCKLCETYFDVSESTNRPSTLCESCSGPGLLPEGSSCSYCGAAGVAMTLDHVVARNKGGTHERSNLVPACKPCNSSKQDLSVDEWLATGRPQAAKAAEYLATVSPTCGSLSMRIPNFYTPNGRVPVYTLRMNTYRKIPVEVQAVRWTGDNLQEIRAFGARCILSVQGGWKLDIATLEGTITASKGDFIIRGVAGEFYPCKPDIFALTYERVLG